MRKTETRSIKDIIADYLKEFHLDTRLKERELIRQWEDVVGRNVSRSTQSIYIKEGKMFVRIQSAVIRNELQWMRDELKRELNRRAGEEIISELIIH